MPRYIDADKLETVVYELNFERAEKWGITRGEFKLIDSVLFEFPTADVVEVVRCKDCKYYVPDDYNCMQMDTGGWIYNPDDYCSFAEKKKVIETKESEERK